jgi:hypothetical protein
MGTSPTRKRNPLGPYRKPMPRVLGGVLGVWAFSYGRGTPVGSYDQALSYEHRPASPCVFLTLKKTRTDRFPAFS